MNTPPATLQAGLDFSFYGIDFSGFFVLNKITDWRLMAVAQQPVSLSRLLADVLQADLPDVLPELMIDSLALTVNANGDSHCHCTLTFFKSRIMALGDVPFPVSSVVINLCNRAGEMSASIQLNGFELRFANDFTIKKFSFNFIFDVSLRAWHLTGEVNAVIADRALTLIASYTDDTKPQLHFYSQLNEFIPLIVIEDVISLQVAELGLTFMENAQGHTICQFDARGQIELGRQLLVFQGSVSAAFMRGESIKLSLHPDEKKLMLPLPNTDGLAVGFGEFSIFREVRSGRGSTNSDSNDRSSANRTEGNWVFCAESSLAVQPLLSLLPKAVRARLPTTLVTRFKADKKSAQFTAEKLLESIDIQLPDTEFHRNNNLQAGMLRLSLQQLSFTLSKSNTTLSVVTAIGLPTELNSVFGVSENGSPAFSLFNTFDANDPDRTMFKMCIALGAKGITLQLLSTPITLVTLAQRGGKSWWDCDFGVFGAIALQVPEFSYRAKKAAFTASGGFEIIRPLSLPLAPLKAMLMSMHCETIAALVPMSLPIKSIHFLDEHGHVRVKELGDFINRMIPGDTLPPAINASLNTLARVTHKLPAAFKDYLRFEIPQSLSFEISGSAKGNIIIKLSAKDNPIKLLYPTVMGGMPALQGVTLRSLSFGIALSGSLIILEVDLWTDLFDLPSLAAAMLLPENHRLPLPQTQDFQRRIIIDDLFMLVALVSGVPVPIPVFYDELAIEFLGIEGVKLQGHIKLPKPELDIADIGKVVADLVRFSNDPDALLDPDALGNADLCFAVGQNYLQLPQYLGGKLLGYQGSDIAIKAYATLAKVLNVSKTFSLNSVITAIPDNYRMGHEQLSFGPLTLQSAWLLTTAQSFYAQDYQKFHFTEQQKNAMLDLLPATDSEQNVPDSQIQSQQQNSLALFLHGESQLADWCAYQVNFALAATSACGFSTGFAIKATIAGQLEMALVGRVVINGGNDDDTEPALLLVGHSHLGIMGESLFSGDVQLSDKQLYIRGEIKIFPGNPRITLGGYVEGLLSESEFLLAGRIEGELGDFTLFDMHVHFSQVRLYFSATALGATVELDIKIIDGQYTLEGALTLSLLGLSLRTVLAISSENTTLKATVDPLIITGLKIGETEAVAELIVANNTLEQAVFTTEVSLLGINNTTVVTVTQSHFGFTTTGKLFGQSAARLTVNGSAFNASGIMVAVAIDFALLNDISQNIHVAIAASVNRISDKWVQSRQVLSDKHQQLHQERADKLKTLREQVNTERSATGDKIANTRAAVVKAQQKVDVIKRAIVDCETQIDELKKQGYWLFPEKQKGWIPDPKAVAKIGLLKAKMTEKWAEQGSRIGALESAKAVLKLTGGMLDRIPIDSDPRIAVMLSRNLVENGAYLTLKKVAAETQKRLDQCGDLTQDIAAGMQFIQIHGIGCNCALDQYQGSNVNMTVDYTFRKQRSQKILCVDLRNPASMVGELCSELLPFADNSSMLSNVS